MKIDQRFLTGSGPEIFTGNELLLKGALETEGGVHLLGGYPGSPIAGYFDTMIHIKDLLSQKGIRASMSNNEALAAAMLNGSQVVGCRGMIAMKSVGVHVAADALALGCLAGAHPEGGAVVVCGDDPWSDSTQVASDSRFLCKHLFMPVVEPSTPQEVKDYIDLSFKLSRSAELYIGYVLTTNLADGGGTVQCRENHYPEINTANRIELDTDAINADKFVLLPPRTWWQEENLTDRFDRAKAKARALGLNQILYPSSTRKPIGFVTSGLAHAYLVQALGELRLLGQAPILKFGMSYPVDEQLVRELAGQCDRIVVIEERRSFLEAQISEILLQDRQAGLPSGQVELWGKIFPEGLKAISSIRGLHPSILVERLVPLLEHIQQSGATIGSKEIYQKEKATLKSTAHTEIGQLPPRTPTFCPGCPHRDTASLCLEIKKHLADPRYMRKKYKSGPVDLMFHGDTGCYTMLLFPPNTSLMHDYSGMGLGAGTGSGTDPFITNKQVVFMGDSTFFHSGQLAISNAIKLGQDITFVILDNSTTAMTGHQPTAGVNYDITGQTTDVQDIEEIVNGIATEDMLVLRADPEKRRPYARLLEETFLSDGVKIIIATKECGITRGRRQRRKERQIRKQLGYLPTSQRMNINQEICRFCLACAEMTGCPGLKHVDTDYGRKMDTDISWCVNDGACERIGACSSFEHVIIKRKQKPRLRVPELGLENIPEPEKRPTGDLWRCCLAGVGGMGIGVATSIVLRAGHKEGYEVIFVDKKGLAIRNGGVTSQVVYNIANKEPVSAIIPYGKADLLIGIDVLEAARTLDPQGRVRIASREKTSAVVNTDKVNTILGVMGMDDFDPDKMEALVREHTRSDDYLARNISRICEKYLGSKLYSNIMMLGFAFQKGLIPVSMHSMAWAIKDTIGTDFRKNLYAFNMGRKLVVQPDLFQGPPARTGWKETLEDKCRFTVRRYRNGQERSGELRELAASTIQAAEELDEASKRNIVIRLYDCMRWGGLDYARRYAKNVLSVYAQDHKDYSYAATKAVLWNLAEAMLIKDGVFLAELATSPEKYARDREKYIVNPANGDRMRYRHLWNWTTRIGPWSWKSRMVVFPWMLKLLKRSKWLRHALPGWHATEKQYLAGLEQRISRFRYTNPMEYAHQLHLLESAECMNCTNPRCKEQGCPLGNTVPQWLQLVYQERWEDACSVLHETNNFPEFTSRICPAFCQEACKQGLRGYPVQVREIEKQIVDLGFEKNWILPQPAPKSGRRVAVVGSGPAGLACAQQLARAGHEVTVFEKDEALGGLLRYGIPDFRLEKDLLDRRLEQLRKEGVFFRTGQTIGKDLSLQTLRSEFDAVCLSTGARKSRGLNVPGQELPGVHPALDFLSQQNRRIAGVTIPEDKKIWAQGKTVLVIGGGETGNDCVETALLQGAKEVHQWEILPQPETPSEDAVEHENLHRRWKVRTVAFEGNGQVQNVSAVRVDWVNSPAGRKMEDISQSTLTLHADLVLLATGFDAELSPEMLEQLGQPSKESVLRSDQKTPLKNVFTAGDLINGASYVATAIASGRSAAEKIDQYLKKSVNA